MNINDKTRIIATSDDLLLVTNDEEANFDTIKKNGFIVNTSGEVVSSYQTIGFLTKYTLWEPTDIKYSEFRKERKVSSKDWLFGFAVGDAFGVPVEFMSRKDIKKLRLDDMKGNMSHNVPVGSWSDDTSMTIATMDSIINMNGDINYEDIMSNFIEWLTTSKYSSTDYTFGVGGIIFKALSKYERGTKALECGCSEIRDNGNGSLMRICPISIYCIENGLNEEETVKVINEASGITHAHDISKMGCFIYTEFLRVIYDTKDVRKAFDHICGIDYSKYYSDKALKEYEKLLSKKFLLLSEEDIKESGYVVDTLESVIYSIISTNNYRDAIKFAVNLGYDTDTVAGITGSIAGTLYGFENIPYEWLVKLQKVDYLEEICEKFDSVVKKNEEVNKKL